MRKVSYYYVDKCTLAYLYYEGTAYQISNF